MFLLRKGALGAELLGIIVARLAEPLAVVFDLGVGGDGQQRARTVKVAGRFRATAVERVLAGIGVGSAGRVLEGL